MIAYYSVILILSLIVTIVYFIVWHNHFNTLITIYFILLPVTNLGFFLLAIADNENTAIAGNILTYIGGCYVLLFSLFLICNICGITLNKWVRSGMMIVSTAIFNKRDF